MARKQYEITYPDGSKAHVTRRERDMQLADLQQVGPTSYKSTLQLHTFHQMSDLGQLRERMGRQEYRHFLPGTWLFELKGKRYRQLEATSEHMALTIDVST